MSNAGVLTALDEAKTQLYHFTAIIIAGMGFFTDAYDLFSISTVTKLIGRIYFYNPATGKPGSIDPDTNAALNAVALCGTLGGQLFFGWLGDKLGRKSVYGMTLLIMIFCATAQGLSLGHTADAVITTLCFFRFWLGFGVGGDYPLSATIMSEYSNRKTRGAFIAAVFSMQGIGILVAASFSILISGIFVDNFPAPQFQHDPIRSTPPESDYVWRIILMFGGLPALLTFYYRVKMPETARYTALIEKNAAKAAADMGGVLQTTFQEEDGKVDIVEEYGLFSSEFSARHGVHLIATSSTWFLLDVAFYSQNLFQKDVFSAIGWIPKNTKMSAIWEVYQIAKAQALIALFSTVPGYYVTVATIDIIGRYLIQLQGFFFMTLFMGILAGWYPTFRGTACPAPNQKDLTCNGQHTWFVILYALTFFFANFGPNATTFVVPAEIFPARLRSTCHGISAAFGKLGAIVGTFGFLYAAQDSNPIYDDAGYDTGIGIRWSLAILAVCNSIGFFMTFFVPETKGRSLEDLSGELDDAMAKQNGSAV